jgi:AcrR family transcriptional regulator
MKGSSVAVAKERAARLSSRIRPRGQADLGEQRSAKSAGILLKAAFELFARQSYANVTIKNIAEATGFNASLIYYYYENKENLFTRAIEATVEEAFEHFATISERAATPEDVIGLWIELHIEQYVPLQKLAKISLDYASTVNRQSSVDAAIARFYEKEAELLRKAIRDGIVAGRFRDVDPEATSEFISTFLDGSLFRQVMFPHFDPAFAIRNMRKVVIGHLQIAPLPPAVVAAGSMAVD